MDNVYVYCVSLPPKIHEMVMPCDDGFTIYINVNDSITRQEQAYTHAMRHINNDDFGKEDVQGIEQEAHYGKV